MREQSSKNAVALHIRKLCDAWTDWGYGDFSLFYVRDREKREVDFLITDRHKAYALIECKLRAEGIDSSLRYFSSKLKPKHALQVVREPQRGESLSAFGEILSVPATVFLSLNPTQTQQRLAIEQQDTATLIPPS